jgi:hypothetical protein
MIFFVIQNTPTISITYIKNIPDGKQIAVNSDGFQSLRRLCGPTTEQSQIPERKKGA